MNDPTPERCNFCGCVLRYRPSRFRENLAPKELRTALVRELASLQDWQNFRRIYRERTDPYGYREVWHLGTECPGCGRREGRTRPEFPGEAEAEAAAREQNRALDAPETAGEIARWRQEVRGRSERDARYFAGQLLARLPRWKPYLEYIYTGDERVEREPKLLEWECSLLLTAPSPNPQMPHPLEARVLRREVRIAWGRLWHTHVEPLPKDPDEDLTYLDRAVNLLARVVEEEIGIGIRYRGESPSGGFHYPIEKGPPPKWMELSREGPGWADRIALRSWRGTHDQVLALPREDGR